MLLYSSDEDELSLVSDRVLVLGKGKVVAEFTAENISRDVIVEAMVGYSDVESQPRRRNPSRERLPRDSGLSAPTPPVRCALCRPGSARSYLLTQPTLRVWVLALGLLIFYFVLSPSSTNFGSLNLLDRERPSSRMGGRRPDGGGNCRPDRLERRRVMSLSTAIAATQMGSSDVDVFVMILVIVLIGAALGVCQRLFRCLPRYERVHRDDRHVEHDRWSRPVGPALCWGIRCPMVSLL